jgi:hypothetical protein
MKKLYKKLMKTSALICLLLLGTGNVWGEVSWTCPQNNIITGNGWLTLGSTGVYLEVYGYHTITNTYGNVVPSGSNPVQHINTYKAIEILARYDGSNTDNTANIKSDNAGVVTITASSAATGGSTLTVVHGSTVLGTYHVAEVNKTSGAGTDITIDMEANEVYNIYSDSDPNHNFFIKKVTFSTPGSDFIVFDENKTMSENKSIINTAANGNSKKKIRIMRTLTADRWNTLCLPFSITYSVFGNQLNCEAVYEMTGFEDGTVTFSPVKTSNGKNWYKGYTPVLVKPSQTMVNPIFQLQYASHLYDTDNTNNAQNREKTINGLSFIGIYGTENIYDADHSNFFVSNNTLKYPSDSDNGTIKGFRAYFHLANGTQIKGFAFEDGATGIITVESDPFEENANVYTIDGRNLGNTKNLSRGIYIQNGRKFVVK